MFISSWCSEKYRYVDIDMDTDTEIETEICMDRERDRERERERERGVVWTGEGRERMGQQQGPKYILQRHVAKDPLPSTRSHILSFQHL
jgi:hypothetical protein